MTTSKTLQRGDQVPRFEVRTLDGRLFSYSSIWQLRNLVLVTLPDRFESSYASALAGLAAEFESRETTCVITRDRLAGVPTPGAVVADRWGEIVYVATGPEAVCLPHASELIEWIDYVRMRCAECEGEAK
jgi:hypothetical protein